MEVLFHVVLYEPEIPQNTGNIGRLCLATGCVLHIVGRPAFSLSDKAVRRAGLDYWKRVEVAEHGGFDEIASRVPRDRIHLFSTAGERSLYDIRFRRGDYLVFGPETRGLPEEMKKAHAESLHRIPMPGRVRSLNLANAVAVAVYEGFRQVEGEG